MTTWITTLARADADAIWEQVQHAGWWTYNSKRLGGVEVGDDIYVWRAEQGWVGHLRVTGRATGTTNTPTGWLHQGSGGFPVRVVAVLAGPSPTPRPSELTTTPLPHAPQLTDVDKVALLSGLFGSSAHPEDNRSEPVAIKSGWSNDQSLIKNVEQAAVAFVRAKLLADGWQEVRDRQRDGCGYDLDYRHSKTSVPLHVEVKGTTSTTPRFMLTRLEHEVLRKDDRARVYLVLEALTSPRLAVYDFDDLSALGLVAERWRVG